MFTVAEHWNGRKRSADEERLFALLRERLDDSSEAVRLEAAHFLSLLSDSRSEPAIARLRKSAEHAGSPMRRSSRWGELGSSDRSRTIRNAFRSSTRRRGGRSIWPRLTVGQKGTRLAHDEERPPVRFREGVRPLFRRFLLCLLPHRQPRPAANAALAWVRRGTEDLAQRASCLYASRVARGALPLEDVVFLDLQMGGNDLLFRVNHVEGACGLYVHYRTLSPVSTDFAGENQRRSPARETEIAPYRFGPRGAGVLVGELAKRRPPRRRGARPQAV